MKAVALATSPGSADISQDDVLLASALISLGVSAEILVWDDPQVDWSRFDCIAVRTTWDYHLRLEEFLGWARRVAEVTRVANDPRLYAGNAHKAYLLELESAGVPVVPTRLLESGADIDLLLESVPGEASPDWIVKPEVGACALHTYRTAPLDRGALRRLLSESLSRGKVLVQDFMPLILSEGEISLAWIDGRVVHAIRKTASPGDFRVQIDHGGSNRRVDIPAEAVPIAEACLRSLPLRPDFARIDLVLDENFGYRLMELELIEPELMFEWAPESADFLARALLAPSPFSQSEKGKGVRG